MLVEKISLPTVGKVRGYIGASITGHQCDRYLWLNKYKKNKKYEISFRLSRIFDRGHLEENRIWKLIRKNTDIQVFKQEKVTDGVISGHIDAIIDMDIDYFYTPFILEIKTMSERNFKKFQKKGVRISHPNYYAQVQVYMHLYRDAHGDRVEQSIVLAINKNTDELHEEVVGYNEISAKMCIDRAHYISKLDKAPVGFTLSSSKRMECNGCAFEQDCWP